jgi:hypothetical protein
MSLLLEELAYLWSRSQVVFTALLVGLLIVQARLAGARIRREVARDLPSETVPAPDEHSQGSAAVPFPPDHAAAR